MSGKISFRRTYAGYGDNVRPFERANDIGSVITEFLWYEGSPFYPLGDLISANISSVWLGAGEPTKDDEDNLDLVFKMPESDVGQFFRNRPQVEWWHFLWWLGLGSGSGSN